MVFNNVVTEILEKDLCIGCGICKSICPVDNLTINFNNKGLYAVSEKQNCLEKCDLCLKVCPFGINEYTKNETLMAEEFFENHKKYNKAELVGYFDKLFVGFADPEQRLKASSGGLLRSLSSELLHRNIIDSVITLENIDDQEKLFQFTVKHKANEIINSTGSVYYPIEMSEILKYIKNNDGNYLISALPCFAKAIRSAQKYSPILKERIKYIFGITCGQSKSKYFINLLRIRANIPPHEKIKTINFRKKHPDQPANNFAYEIVTDQESYSIFFDEKITAPWNNKMFTPTACSFCDDIFCELSDVSFMDAWLEEYSQDWRGTNIVISRNFQISQILSEMNNNKRITIKPISVTSVRYKI